MLNCSRAVFLGLLSLAGLSAKAILLFKMKKIIYFFVLLFLSFAGIAQTNIWKEVVPPSPTAASLTKYGMIPVNEYTGIPNISIPIYEVTEGDINLPITLNYHASGIKVAEMSSWVGAGWSLNAGGVITRTIMGKEDFSSKNYYEEIEEYLAATPEDAHDISYYMATGLIDSEPDIYHYRFGNYAGKFMLFDDGNFHSIPRNDIKVAVEIVGTTARFILTTPDGIRYVFGRSLDDSKNVYDTSSLNYSDGAAQDIISSFYLVEIIGVNNEHIMFDYDTESYWHTAIPLQTEGHVDYPCKVSSGFQTVNVTASFHGARLRGISWSSGSIDLLPQESDREDLRNSYALDKIIVKNKFEVINTINLSYEYKDRRLFLSQVLDGTQMRPFSFSYNNQSLPDRLSTSTDHWGYFNGKPNGGYYIPTYVRNGVRVERANKNAVSSYMDARVLEKIEYPTGGLSTFEYESNTVFTEHLSDGGLYYSSEILEDDESYTEVSALAQIVNGEFMEQEFELEKAESIKIELFGDNWNYFQNGCMQLIIEGIDNRAYWFYDNMNPIPTTPLEFGKGKYRLKFLRNNYSTECSFVDNYGDVWITAKLSWLVENNTVPSDFNLTVGGLRVKKITTKDEHGIVNEKHYKYDLFLSPEISSGTILNVPKNQFVRPIGEYFCEEWVVSNELVYSLGVTAGSYVGYSNVMVEEISDGVINGKTQSIYTNHLFYPDFYNVWFPYPPPKSFEWKRGLLVERETFKNDNGTYKLVSRLVNLYNFTADKETYAIRGRVHVRSINQASVRSQSYNVVTGITHLAESKEEIFGSGALFQNNSVKTVRYGYDSSKHFQLTTQEVDDSNGKTYCSYFLYPPDFGTGNPVIDEMVSHNVIKNPVESVHGYGIDNNFIVTAGNLQAYNSNVINKPEKIYSLQLASPIQLKDFKFSNNSKGKLPLQGTAISFQMDSRYHLTESVLRFNTKGNPTEILKENNTCTVYLWGYEGQYPVAKIENAAYTEVSGVLGQATINSFNASNVSDATITDAMARLRNDPKMAKAQVTSYTYKPLVGMTSMTDPRGITEYYEYDGFQRLKDVLDFDKKIQRNYQYHYRP